MTIESLTAEYSGLSIGKIYIVVLQSTQDILSEPLEDENTA
jgi:hypothetical protein